MAKDARSFFERLTGSVKIEDTEPEEQAVEISDEPEINEVKSFKQEPGRLPKKKIAKEPALEPEEAEESPAKISFFSKTANKIKERAFEKEQESASVKLPESKAEKKDNLSSPENAAEEPAEVEGQLTVDIYDDGEKIVIQSTVAGVKPEDLDVSITNDMVTIKGRRRKQEEIKDDSYYYRELYWGSFSRSVILPEEIEVEKAEAALKNGLLTVKLPKKNKHIIQKIKVKME
ncbi:MAG: hypothetical protein A3G49_05645 [Candidatus Sungbacteria bacterium RIFCSPLOWO2_12_FULL_41_11]|uniref:SHSP domain-containing protein n=1 Tax=Candidatus Sungbacteria bacterium RIFCSPLOWO2_12_FULL_41_11 TaxID=1802286 RepID=A0A1G2LSQ1_9BACT|nr:MAG: Protein containing Heat shock protein Hsp20 protein [Parcubacteria group bacterium GW2011_GWA2_42_14]OGZ99206.1 MAG: hypothetical protein A3D41_02805 [Candidatus Sungbacteria bacterium RIFCSPHIGHO2_02_FULL_41_12b]OHA14637.1 MAG: hypothetical protein A3G49_05645 [Candidatus Sungbacteria bacterium RIFCSPLOWO2_12_FULL_41_11]